MNKAQLIDALAERFNGNKREAAYALDSVLDAITRRVASGDKVGITGFGTFEKIDRPSRMVRNPRTGEKKRAKKSSVAKFRMGAGLKSAVNGVKKAPAVKKAAVSKATPAKKTATKAAPAKSAASKTTTAKTAAKKTVAKKTPAAKKTAAKKTPAAKKTVAKKSTAAKKLATKSTPAVKKSSAAKTLASKTPARKATAKRAAKKS